ncbi:MAG: NUDIX hydrolase [Actinomycetota bacterium]|nr:NUDIX hydrolase [Actinomycetota bacterium]
MRIDRPPPGEPLHSGPVTAPRQAASVILLRGGEDGLELLLVRRNPAQAFMGGFWVFPGGAVDAGEGEGDRAHRAAAVRELEEEAGVRGVDPSALVKFSRWITPAQIARRFDTHFFLAAAPEGAEPRPDGRECVDARWTTPQAALRAYEAGTLPLVLPTLSHLEQISPFATTARLLRHAEGREVRPIQPRVVLGGETARIVLPGEPGYESGG